VKEPTASEVTAILAHPFDYDWSIQGFGMLRAYLDPDHVWRLHLWDLDSAFPDVSRIHDHPWDFTSRIVVGRMDNQRYEVDGPEGEPYQSARILCGESAHLLEEPVTALVAPKATEHYGPEDFYAQEAPEFHESFPTAGAVTLVKRNFKQNRDVARVLWREGVWGDAAPRPATQQEIEHFVSLAMLPAPSSGEEKG
jgi:hypothetical protein